MPEREKEAEVDLEALTIEFLPDGNILFPKDPRLLTLAEALGAESVCSKIREGEKTKFLMGGRLCG